MGFVGSLLGGSSGAGFQAGGTNILNPATQQQADQLYAQGQTGIQQQQNFLQALQGQQGITNQSNVFNQQQGLANQLQGVANGTGPNPALAQLAQSTGANTANQAALMAGQRGTGANAGLLARQAAMQGGANQQQAAGQGATLQAQQQLAAMNQLQGQQANMGNLATQQVGQQANATTGYNTAVQNEQQNILNSIQGQNNANVAMKSNQNSVNGNIANTNAKGQSDMFGGLLGGVSSAAQGLVGQAISSRGIPGLGSVVGSGAAGAGGGEAALGGTLGSGVATGAELAPEVAMAAAHGGMVPQKMADGGAIGVTAMPDAPNSGPQSAAGQYLKNNTSALPASTPSASSQGQPSGMEKGGSGLGSLVGSVAGMAGGALGLAKGGQVPALVSPGERYLPPSEVKKVAEGKKSPMKAGEKIPGKAKVKGDSYANDTVPKTLESGGIVLPKHITEAKHPAWAAHKFVSAILAKQNMKAKK